MTVLRHPEGARVQKGLRVLFFDGDSLYGARGLCLVRSRDRGRTWQRWGRVVVPRAYRAAARFRLTQRLGRLEVYKLQRSGDTVVALARGGVYIGKVQDGTLRLSFRAHRPVSLAVGPAGEIVFGEYHSNAQRGPMRIYRSEDGQTWDRVHEFAAGEIRHVHGIYHDPYAMCYWVLVGDVGQECGIVRCSLDFRDVNFVRRGSQQVRAYSMIIRPEGLYFGTDSENEANAIYRMDHEGHHFVKLHDIENSCFHSGMFGEYFVFSTVCEPSPRNDERWLHLWVTRDGTRWHKAAMYPKDRLPYLFQYGNLFFPEGRTNELSELVYSGTSLQGLDDVAVFVPVESLANE